MASPEIRLAGDFDQIRDLCAALARCGFPSLRVYEGALGCEVQHPTLGLLHVSFHPLGE